MDKTKKDMVKKISILFVMLILVSSIMAGFYITNLEEAEANEIVYNELLTHYDDIIEEHGEYSLEAFAYNEIMDQYKSDYVPIWFVIFAFGMISLAVYCVWYAVFNMWLVVYK